MRTKLPPLKTFRSVGHLALAYASSRWIRISTDDPERAQRDLELAILQLPKYLRPACVDWAPTVRRWAALTGRPNPRVKVSRQGFWPGWLAKLGFMERDVLDALDERKLVDALPEVAAHFASVRVRLDERVFRRHGWSGCNNDGRALILKTLADGRCQLFIGATRDRSAALARASVKVRERYHSTPPSVKKKRTSVNRRRRQRARFGIADRA